MPGNIHVIVDDGSGVPSIALLASIGNSLELVRPVGTTITVAGPIVVTANIELVLEVMPNCDAAAVETLVIASLESYVSNLGVCQAFRYSRIAGLCFDASSNIVNVTSVTLNGGVSDIGGQSNVVVRYSPASIIVVAG